MSRRKTPDDSLAPRSAQRCAGDHEIAEARDVRWLGPEVPNVFTPTTWECPQGHRWQSAYQNLRRGSGCPQCRRRG